MFSIIPDNRSPEVQKAIQERRDYIVAARQQGQTLEQIAQFLGITKSRVHQIYKAATERQNECESR